MNLIREYLMRLAYTMQTKKLKRMEVYDAVQMLKEFFPAKKKERPPVYKRHMQDIFEEIESHCGLLRRWSSISEEVEFLHLSFQEFLAAKHMMDNDIDYNEFVADPWWEEALLLYTGLMNLEMKKKSNEIVKAILTMYPGDENKHRYLQLLGAKALRDFPPSRRETDAVELAREKLMILIHSDALQENRFNAGEILGCLGDPRIKSDTMVKIERGDFLRGSNEDDHDEKPQRCIYLAPFMIGRYPITNEEFKGFIEDGGYNREEFWTTEGWQWRNIGNISEPAFWHNRQWNGPNFPVVGISWYEACSFAEWLSKNTGKTYRLPTGAEWEKTARGTNGLIYPWGCKFDKALCNSYESLLRRTSPVGIFPKGKSPYGCMDMAGNLWEWCSDWFDSDYYAHSPDKNPKGPPGGSFRVIRGGGWFSDDLLCRASCRHYDCPSFRGVVVGFRLVRSVEEVEKVENNMEKGTDQKIIKPTIDAIKAPKEITKDESEGQLFDLDLSIEPQRHLNPVKKILILLSNPITTPRRRLDEEIREIKEGLRRAKYRSQFQMEPILAVRHRDFQRALLDYLNYARIMLSV